MTSAIMRTRKTATRTFDLFFQAPQIVGKRHFSSSARRFCSSASFSKSTVSSSSSSTSQGQQQQRRNLFAQYIHFCNTYQMTAAIVTSFVLWSLGDIITQKMESSSSSISKVSSGGGSASTSHSPGAPSQQHSSGSPSGEEGYFGFLNRRRLVATAVFGVSIIGVGGFYWYRLLDHVVRVRMGLAPEKSGFFKFTAAKLGIEFAVWHPITLAIFWLMVGTYADGKTMAEVGAQLKTDLLTALACDISLWLPIDILNFRYTPVHLQVIVVNLGSLFEAVLLSYLHSAGSAGHGAIQ